MIYDVRGNLLSETTGQSTTTAYAHPSTASYGYDQLDRVVTRTRLDELHLLLQSTSARARGPYA